MRGKRDHSRPRALRAGSTDAERQLWFRLRDRRLNGWKFRRQMPIGPYIVDFVCVEAQLVVELDGSQHLERLDYDNRRTDELAAMGYRVMRVWNEMCCRGWIVCWRASCNCWSLLLAQLVKQ